MENEKEYDENLSAELTKEQLAKRVKYHVSGVGDYVVGDKTYTYADFKVWVADSEERLFNLESYERQALFYNDEGDSAPLDLVNHLNELLNEWIGSIIDEVCEELKKHKSENVEGGL